MHEKLKICIISAGEAENSNRPLSNLVQAQAESLKAKGVGVFFRGVSGKMSVKSILKNLRRLRKEIKQLKPSLVHAQYGSMIALIACMAKKEAPFIVSFGGSDLLGIPFGGLNWRGRNFLAKDAGLFAAYRAKTIIVKSRNLLDVLPEKLRGKTIILPNGVDTDCFRPMPKYECRTRHGWGENEKIVLFFASTGRSHNQVIKNKKLAHDAVSILKKQDPCVKLFVASKVTREEVVIMMNAADCLLLTSLHEGSPNVVKEAMACNLPVVSAPCGDVKERLQKVSPGGVYEYDPVGLAEGIRRVLFQGIRSNGRKELISQGLGAPDVAASLIEIYKSAQGAEPL